MNYVRHLNVFFNLVRKDKTLRPGHISLYMCLFQYWNYHRFQCPFPVHRDNLLLLSKIGSRGTYQECLKDLHKAGYIFCHSRASQFDRVKISMVRLDERKEKSGSKQLDFFSELGDCSRPENEPGEKNPRPANGPVSGPILTGYWPENGPVAGPKMGHIYKLNNKTINSVCNTPTKIFNKNHSLNEAIGEVIQDAPRPKIEQVGITTQPTLSDVQDFFKEQNFPGDEAQKFFLYNEGKAWMFSPQLKIQNWQSLARKWMLNANGNKSSGTVNSQIIVNNDKDYGEPL